MIPLRLLHVEDSEDDAELLLIHLRRAGFQVHARRVLTPESFVAALEEERWQVIVADHSMPGFGATRALSLLKQRGVDVPFVVLSGTISTATAVELMHAGAHDFIAKDDLARMEPVLHRELREAANRQARRQAESDRERMLSQLETANRAKDEFLAMLGHELRNPLAPIVTALELMKLRGATADTREREIIERQVSHLVRLVDDLLDVARIARGKVALKRRPFELAVAVAQAVEMTSPLVEQRRHQLKVDVPASGLLVEADQGRLAQVVSNLLSNAALYTPPGGRISVEGSLEGTWTVLRVKDSGIGIEPDLLPRIFDTFVQGSRSLDRREGGLGLGLALVRNLVQLHGGTVSAQSEGRDRGSDFTVCLPTALPLAEPSPSAGPAPARGPKKAKSSLRVLIVDDNEDAAEILAEAVRLEGYEVKTAHDGPSALSLMSVFRPQVVVLDIGLPVMDGYEVAKEIRARPEHQATRLLALTGYGQPSDRARSLGAGFALHLVKPVELSELILAIEGPAS